MTIEQTVEIPAHPTGEVLRLTIEVPREVPAGRAILTFTLKPAELESDDDDDGLGYEGECPLDHTPNAETAAAIREGRAMMRGEIPAHWYNSVDELWEDLHK